MKIGKIIFSRKGFDLGSGGGASPILPDKTMLSLPIPDYRSGITYADLSFQDRSLLEIMHELGYTNYRSKFQCHLDPDIRPELIGQDANVPGLFGQVGASLGHLQKQEVGIGDLFLFWGRFQHTERVAGKLQFTGKPFHAIYGYLHVENVINAGEGERAEYNPSFVHFREHYKGSPCLVYEGDAGTLDYTDRLKLSCDEKKPSLWQIPASLKEAGLSYHGAEDRWLDGNKLQTVARGQEFVSPANQELRKWAKNLIQG